MSDEQTLAKKSLLHKSFDIPILGDLINMVLWAGPPLAVYWLSVNVLGLPGGIESPGWLIALWTLAGIWAICLEHILRIRMVLPIIPIPLKYISVVLAVYWLVRLVWH